MESLNILHLSDFHIGNFRYENPATLAIKIADVLYYQGRKVDVIVVSGDIFDGRSRTFEKDLSNAINFFRTIITQLISKKISPDSFDENSVLFVPGNHDLKREEGKEYEKYDAFINGFFPNKASNKVKVIDDYNFICDFSEKKIAILGFNSCRIQIERVKEDELKWIDKLNFPGLQDKASEIKQIIKKYKESEKNWDDFGYIDPVEMDNVFAALRAEVPNYMEYNIVATFHHHFYPFPEIVNRYPDASFIRNYTDVLDKFQRFKVQLVLHGHKHLSIQRAITDNKYFENPESIIYVLSAGSVGCKDVYNPSFQWLRVYDRSFPKLAEGEKYDFKDEELDNVKEFTLPPQKKEEKSVSLQLIDALQGENPGLYAEYKKITDDFEQTLQDSRIDKIIEVVSSLITVFNDIKLELRKNSEIIYILLLSLNYRVIYLKQIYSQKQELHDLLDRLKDAIVKVLGNKVYTNDLIDFLSSTTNKDLDKHYQLIIKNVLGSEKRISAYTSIALFFADLFLNISQYGEYYFEKEKLKHKINVKLKKDLFYKNIPNDSISVEGNIDRRAIILNFKCKDPTVHKVAVLIVKDFEMRLNKFEESLKEIKLKLYYILPKVQPYKYDLENFHFDAYIPTLLPLLTGDNLYKQKEVFIRELVQNAVDATLLRTKIKPQEKINTDINIEFGADSRGTKIVKYFRITDNGLGMSRFTIERYFTSIGRSFYISEEFDELKKDNNIKYNAISNFGIGFLSSFMVCKEVLVKTKSILEEDDSNGFEIEIPNYDGCFFIRKTDVDGFGTEITLYEDERKLFDFNKFEDYIKRTLIGLPLAINISFNDEPKRNFSIPSYQLQRHLLDQLHANNLLFYVPFSEDEKVSKALSWSDLKNSTIESLEKFGLSVNFDVLSSTFGSKVWTTNQGLRISEPFFPFKFREREIAPDLTINYPSSFIQLDVAREKVLKIKDKIAVSEVIPQLIKQILEFLTNNSTSLNKCPLYKINRMDYVLRNAFGINTSTTVGLEVFCLKISKIKNGFHLSIARKREIPGSYESKNAFFWSYSDAKSIPTLWRFIKQIQFPSLKQNWASINEWVDVLKSVNPLSTNGQMEKILWENMEKMGAIEIIRILKIIKANEKDKIHEILGLIHLMLSSNFPEMVEQGIRLGNERKKFDSDEFDYFEHTVYHPGERVEFIENTKLMESIKSQKLSTVKNFDYEEFFKLLFISVFVMGRPRNTADALFVCLVILRAVIFQRVKVSNYTTFEVSIDIDSVFKLRNLNTKNE